MVKSSNRGADYLKSRELCASIQNEREAESIEKSYVGNFFQVLTPSKTIHVSVERLLPSLESQGSQKLRLSQTRSQTCESILPRSWRPKGLPN